MVDSFKEMQVMGLDITKFHKTLTRINLQLNKLLSKDNNSFNSVNSMEIHMDNNNNNNLLIHTSNKLKPILINRGSFNSNYSNSNCNSNKVHHRINLHLIHNSSMDSNHTYLNNSYHNNSYSKVDTSLKDSKVNKMLVVSNMVNHNSSVNTHLVRATFL